MGAKEDKSKKLQRSDHLADGKSVTKNKKNSAALINALDSMNPNSSSQIVLDSMNPSSSVQRVLDSMNPSSSVQRVLDSMNPSSSVQRVLDSMNPSSSVQRVLDSMNPSSSIQKVLDSMNPSSSIQKVLDSMNPSSSIQKVLDSMNPSASIQKVLDSMNPSSSIQKVLDSMNQSSSIQKVLDSMPFDRTSQLALASLSQSEAFHKSIATLSQPGYFNAAISVISEHAMVNNACSDLENTELDTQQIEDCLQGVSSSSDQKTFLENFSKLPVLLQYLIFFIFMQVLIPQINSISANILTPHVEKYLSSTTDVKRDKLKEISKVGQLANIQTQGLRFITGNNVRLRSSPSTNSAILDELQLGQVVLVLSKKKNWIEVQYNYNNDETLQGWVFTRYTSNFKK